MALLTERGASWEIVADTASEVELLSVDDDAGVPDTVDLLADHLPRKLGSKSAGEIIDVQHNKVRHS
jgi:hypothetical protein